MPILDVEIVGATASAPGMAAALARVAAEALESRPEGTWVRLRRLAAADYAEGDGGPPPEVRPVFVTVLLAKVPSPARVAQLAARLASALAYVLGRPEENVHVLFEPPAAGRIAFGGKIHTGAPEVSDPAKENARRRRELEQRRRRALE